MTGSFVPLPIDLVEVGPARNDASESRRREPCPPIAAGPGRVILTTINHLNRDVCELTIEDKDGRRETVRPTATHRFYREPDDQWIHLKELKPGDIIRGRAGSVRIAAIGKLPGVHRVFNITVEWEHLYEVSALGVICSQ